MPGTRPASSSILMTGPWSASACAASSEDAMMRIQKSLLLSVFFAIASAHAGLAWGAGKVHFARGDVTALDRAGESRPLVKGDGIEVGDTVVVGAAALAQLKFTDGALVSLQPESSFRVDDYHY